LQGFPKDVFQAVKTFSADRGNENMRHLPRQMREDFAFYLNEVPGAFMFLSSSNHEKGTDVSHHNSKFNVDEDVFWEGPAVFAQIAADFLG